MSKMPPRPRSAEHNDLAAYPGLGRYKDGRFFFRNSHTGRQVSLKTRDQKRAIALWALAKAVADKAYGDDGAAALAGKLQESNTPLSKGGNIHLCDLMQEWRLKMLEPGLVRAKGNRGKGKTLAPRTQRDYIAQAIQIENSPAAAFPVSSPKKLNLIRALLAPWGNTPTHYNHLKAVLARVYDYGVFKGVVDKNPMRDIEKLAVPERTVLIPDEAYVAITAQLLVHDHNKQLHDGAWRARICDLFYMLSQQPIDLFSLRVSQIKLDAGEYGEIHLARHKTGVAGIIEMNADLRECIDWLMEWRKEQLRQGNVVKVPKTDHLLIYPAYMDKRSRWTPVKHRTFSAWWLEARRAAGPEFETYWLMDLRKKGLTDEFLLQGENDKGLHETQAMRDHYRLIKVPKRSQNQLKRIV